MRHLTIFLAALLAAMCFGAPAADAQTRGAKPTAQQNTQQNDDVYLIVEEMPLYPGGDNALRDFLNNEVKYPAEAKKAEAQGRVFVKFVVEKDGSVSGVTAKSNVHPALAKEAERVVKAMPKWRPGKQKGQPVRVAYTVPISF